MISKFISAYIDPLTYTQILNNAQHIRHNDDQITIAFVDKQVYKFFPHKHPLSSDYWIPYVLRLKYITKWLLALKIQTLQIDAIYYYPQDKCYIVTYKFLTGESVHDAVSNGDYALLAKIPYFIAKLHTKGIFFRDLHLDNILIQPHGDFALIDVIRVGFQLWPLSMKRRAYNLAFLLKRSEDQALFQKFGVENFLHYYFAAAKLDPRQQKKFWHYFKRRTAGMPNLGCIPSTPLDALGKCQ